MACIFGLVLRELRPYFLVNKKIYFFTHQNRKKKIIIIIKLLTEFNHQLLIKTEKPLYYTNSFYRHASITQEACIHF